MNLVGKPLKDSVTSILASSIEGDAASKLVDAVFKQYSPSNLIYLEEIAVRRVLIASVCSVIVSFIQVAGLRRLPSRSDSGALRIKNTADGFVRCSPEWNKFCKDVQLFLNAGQDQLVLLVVGEPGWGKSHFLGDLGGWRERWNSGDDEAEDQIRVNYGVAKGFSTVRKPFRYHDAKALPQDVANRGHFSGGNMRLKLYFQGLIDKAADGQSNVVFYADEYSGLNDVVQGRFGKANTAKDSYVSWAQAQIIDYAKGKGVVVKFVFLGNHDNGLSMESTNALTRRSQKLLYPCYSDREMKLFFTQQFASQLMKRAGELRIAEADLFKSRMTIWKDQAQQSITQSAADNNIVEIYRAWEAKERELGLIPEGFPGFIIRALPEINKCLLFDQASVLRGPSRSIMSLQQAVEKWKNNLLVRQRLAKRDLAYWQLNRQRQSNRSRR